MSRITQPPLLFGWILVLSSNNTRRYINISQLVDHLPQDLIDAVPALHAFTGADYTAPMMNKGKL